MCPTTVLGAKRKFRREFVRIKESQHDYTWIFDHGSDYFEVVRLALKFLSFNKHIFNDC